jgi:hypothetical protein
MHNPSVQSGHHKSTPSLSLVMNEQHTIFGYLPFRRDNFNEVPSHKSF